MKHFREPLKTRHKKVVYRRKKYPEDPLMSKCTVCGRKESEAWSEYCEDHQDYDVKGKEWERKRN